MAVEPQRLSTASVTLATWSALVLARLFTHVPLALSRHVASPGLVKSQVRRAPVHAVRPRNLATANLLAALFACASHLSTAFPSVFGSPAPPAEPWSARQVGGSKVAP